MTIRIPWRLRYFAQCAIGELDYIAKEYMECEKKKKRKVLKEEFEETRLHYAHLITKHYSYIFPNVTILTYGIKEYIEIREEDDWRMP